MVLTPIYIVAILTWSALAEAAYTREYFKVEPSFPVDMSNSLTSSVTHAGVTYRFACAQSCNKQHCCCLACVKSTTCYLFNTVISRSWGGSFEPLRLRFDSCHMAKLKSGLPIFPNSTSTSNNYDILNGDDISARNCLEIQMMGYTESGVYRLSTHECCSDNPVIVYCDMETEGGGWTVIQRRRDIVPRENFLRTWEEYAHGFGNLPTGEFWLGLDLIHSLSAQATFELRVDLADFEGETRWAKYSQFYVDDRANFFRLNVSGYSGDAGDSFRYQNGAFFTTIDKDLDTRSDNCADAFKGAWWYKACHACNLNGLYLGGPHATFGIGIEWSGWKGHYYSLKETTMMIRPVK